MSKWWSGPANQVTLFRFPFLILAIYALFLRGAPDFTWYWVGGLAVACGIVTDALDGLVARYIQKGGPTREGQYLDQFVDKWGFVYPLFGALIIWHPLAWHTVLGMTLLLLLDIESCRRHGAAYDESVRLNTFDKNKGANGFGKAKFWMQNIVICQLIASRAPAAPQTFEWWALASESLAAFAKLPAIGIAAQVAVWLAVLCACVSLRRRPKSQASVAPSATSPIRLQP